MKAISQMTMTPIVPVSWPGIVHEASAAITRPWSQQEEHYLINPNIHSGPTFPSLAKPAMTRLFNLDSNIHNMRDILQAGGFLNTISPPSSNYLTKRQWRSLPIIQIWYQVDKICEITRSFRQAVLKAKAPSLDNISVRIQAPLCWLIGFIIQWYTAWRLMALISRAAAGQRGDNCSEQLHSTPPESSTDGLQPYLL